MLKASITVVVMKVTILGSCRQRPLSKFFDTTSIQESLTCPHYTKEIIQTIQYCKGINTFNNDLTKYCFRTGILENKVISNKNELQVEFNNTDIFVIEIASRLCYTWNNIYVHHILTEDKYGFHDIPNISIRELSDKEIEDDIVEIKNLLYPKKILIIPHIYTKNTGKRYELAMLIQQITRKYNIPFMNPSELFKNQDNVFESEHPLFHYTENGKFLVGEEYKRCIDELFFEKKVCISKYLTVCKTNPQPPGLADFLRGTIALYNFSKKYNYNLFIDDSHPIFKYFKPNEYIIKNNTFSDTIEMLPPMSYDDIYTEIENLFSTGKSICIMTNSFYIRENDKLVWGKITDDCRNFIKSILTPSDELLNKLHTIFDTVYGFNIDEQYKVIHLRFGDKFIHNNIFDENIYNFYFNRIRALINQNISTKYILISDSSSISRRLKDNIPELYYWDNSKVHLGDLINNTSCSILDTLIDFFIMSRSNEIISCTSSGFSLASSLIYNINYSLI